MTVQVESIAASRAPVVDGLRAASAPPRWLISVTVSVPAVSSSEAIAYVLGCLSDDGC